MTPRPPLSRQQTFGLAESESDTDMELALNLSDLLPITWAESDSSSPPLSPSPATPGSFSAPFRPKDKDKADKTIPSVLSSERYEYPKPFLSARRPSPASSPDTPPPALRPLTPPPATATTTARARPQAPQTPQPAPPSPPPLAALTPPPPARHARARALPRIPMRPPACRSSSVPELALRAEVAGSVSVSAELGRPLFPTAPISPLSAVSAAHASPLDSRPVIGIPGLETYSLRRRSFPNLSGDDAEAKVQPLHPQQANVAQPAMPAPAPPSPEFVPLPPNPPFARRPLALETSPAVLGRRTSFPLLTPHSDYRLSPCASLDEGAGGAACRLSEDAESPVSPLLSTLQSEPRESHEHDSDVPETPTLQVGTFTVSQSKAPWNDETYFLSPLDRIGAQQPPRTPRQTKWEERRNLAVLLPEAGPTLVSATNTPAGSACGSPVGRSRPDIGRHTSFGSQLGRQSFRLANDVPEEDEWREWQPRPAQWSPVDSARLQAPPPAVCAADMRRQSTTSRVHRAATALHASLVAPSPTQSYAALESTMPASMVMKSLPSLPSRPSIQSLPASRSVSRSESRRWRLPFRHRGHEKLGAVPERSESEADADAEENTGKAIRKSLLFPPEPEVDETFSVSRPPSRRRLLEAATCFVRDADGKPVCFGDFFPQPTTSGRRRASAPAASASAPRPTRTLLVFIRNFWCGMCQDYTVRSLARLDPAVVSAAGVRVVVIGCGDWRMIRAYRRLFGLQFECYADGPRRLYELMGMVRPAAFMQPLRNRPAYNRPYFHQVVSGVRNGIAHMGGPLADPGYWRQLGGEFVLGPGLSCEVAHRMTHMANHMEAGDVLAQAGVGDAAHRVSLPEAALRAAVVNEKWARPMPQSGVHHTHSHRSRGSPSPTPRPGSPRAEDMHEPPPPGLVRSGSGPSSEGTVTECVTAEDEDDEDDEDDPLEMHRRFYSILAESPKPSRNPSPMPKARELADIPLGTPITVS